MPLYPYDCLNCGHHEDILKSMGQSDYIERCSKCKTVMERDFAFHRPEGTPYQKPIEMFGIAPENPIELAELRRKLPDVELTDQLVPIARTYEQKKQILAATGFEDRSGRGG